MEYINTKQKLARMISWLLGKLRSISKWVLVILFICSIVALAVFMRVCGSDPGKSCPTARVGFNAAVAGFLWWSIFVVALFFGENLWVRFLMNLFAWATAAFDMFFTWLGMGLPKWIPMTAPEWEIVLLSAAGFTIAALGVADAARALDAVSIQSGREFLTGGHGTLVR